jgi:hypothetical protein
LFQEQSEEGKESFYDERYLWVRPSEDNLQFIKQQIVKAGCCQLVSIGCGSGLLEWLIHAATGKNNILNNNALYSLEIFHKLLEKSVKSPNQENDIFCIIYGMLFYILYLHLWPK